MNQIQEIKQNENEKVWNEESVKTAVSHIKSFALNCGYELEQQEYDKGTFYLWSNERNTITGQALEIIASSGATINTVGSSKHKESGKIKLNVLFYFHPYEEVSA